MNETRLLKSITVKSGDITGNKLACIPSVCGNLDSYDDVIFPPKKAAGVPGPFAKALPQFLKSGFNPLDHHWEWSAIVAYPTMIEERGNQLYSECEFHSDQASQDALTKCKERLAAGKDVGLSIGFSMQPGQYVYFDNGAALLAYAKKGGWDLSLFDVPGITAHTAPCCGILEIDELFEYSLTPSPANRSAQALAVKKNNAALGLRSSGAGGNSRSAGEVGTRRGNTMTKKLNTICGAPGLVLAADDAVWSAKGAVQRLRDYTGAGQEPNADYAKCFILVDGPNDEFESYKIPFADVVNGAVVAVPAALRSAANVLGGLSGSPVALTDTAQASARTFVETYYAKMDGQRTPWAKDTDGRYCWKGQYLGDYVEYSMCMSAMQSAFYALQYECADAMTGYGPYGDMSEDDLMSSIEGMFDEHKTLCLTIIKAIMSGDADETTETASKSVRREMTATMSNLGDGLTYSKHARLAVDAARELTVRTKARIEMRLKDARAISEANRIALKEHKEALGECVTALDELIARTDPKANTEKARAARIAFLRLTTSNPAAA